MRTRILRQKVRNNMNARQKAKHYKKLYERLLPREPYIINTYDSVPMEHHKIACLVSMSKIAHDLQDKPLLLKTLIENRILHNLKPLIWDHLRIEKDLYTDAYKYQLDIWLES
jgi:hypothetical protein